MEAVAFGPFVTPSAKRKKSHLLISLLNLFAAGVLKSHEVHNLHFNFFVLRF